VGQATHFLGYAGKVERRGRDADRLAYHRDVLDYRNCLLVEQPNGDFARTMARQLLFSTYQKMLFDRLLVSADDFIASVSAKAVKEVAYHEELAAEWVIRLGDGTEESRQRMADGLAWNWRFIPSCSIATTSTRRWPGPAPVPTRPRSGTRTTRASARC
jgi:ring-1,2-phenylacetyl-CoA epoxidase subunit PaaC